MSLIFNFFTKYYKFIFSLIIICIISYFIFNYISGKNRDPEFYQKIDSINESINRIEVKQKKLDSNITHYNVEINKIDSNINKIKIEKTTINNVYHEKINDVNNYTDDQLDSFFTIRYGYIPQH